MFILCSTFVILQENNGDNLLPSMRVTAVSTPSSTNDAGKYLSPILPNTRFRKRSTYEFLLTFQSKYSAMKKSSISSFPNSLVDDSRSWDGLHVQAPWILGRQAPHTAGA